jgi:hypothetical protein
VRRMDDDEIRSVVKRLSRPHPSGGEVIERAAILAAGGDFQGILAWIAAHDGQAEAAVSTAGKGGLHGSRLEYRIGGEGPTPLRFVLPAGALA